MAAKSHCGVIEHLILPVYTYTFIQECHGGYRLMEPCSDVYRLH